MFLFSSFSFTEPLFYEPEWTVFVCFCVQIALNVMSCSYLISPWHAKIMIIWRWLMTRQGVFLTIQYNTINLNAIKLITSSKRTNLYCFCFNKSPMVTSYKDTWLTLLSCIFKTQQSLDLEIENNYPIVSFIWDS